MRHHTDATLPETGPWRGRHLLLITDGLPLCDAWA
jgi:hypothetical protein